MRATGITLAGENLKHMRELSNKRIIAATLIARSYRSIDFVLGNMLNSYVQRAAVFMQYDSRPLNKHLSPSKWWDFGRKQGGLFVSTPTVTATSSDWYCDTVDVFCQSLQFLKNCHGPYAVIASGDCVHRLDYNKVLEHHIEKKADITVVCKEAPALGDLTRLGVVETNGDNRITQFDEKPIVAGFEMISCGIYIVRRKQSIELIEKCAVEDHYDFVRDILVQCKNLKRIYAYKLDPYWSNIASVELCFRINMDFLQRDTWEYFLRTYLEIHAEAGDLPPAKYNPGAGVRNSLVSDGCIPSGRVEDSVLFQRVFVGQSYAIRNSVILNDVYIGNDTVIKNYIIES